LPDYTSNPLLNWGNSLRNTEDGSRYVAAQTAAEYKRRGFSASEATDLMVADDFDPATTATAVQGLYAEAMAAAEEEREISAQAMVVPTSYDDVSNVVEAALASLSSRDFVDRLTSGNNPVLRVNAKSLSSWYRLAQFAKDDPHALEVLHSDLKPWFEDAMLSSVLAAEQSMRQKRVSLSQAKGSNHRFCVSSASGEGTLVCLATSTCSCDRFQQGNYEDFGLACEHIVAVADSVSPHQRLARSLQSDVQVHATFSQITSSPDHIAKWLSDTTSKNVGDPYRRRSLQTLATRQEDLRPAARVLELKGTARVVWTTDDYQFARHVISLDSRTRTGRVVDGDPEKRLQWGLPA